MNLNECYQVVISITWNMEPVFVFLPKYFARHAALQNKYLRASQVSFKSKELIREIMTISWGQIQHQNSIFHTKTFWKIRPSDNNSHKNIIKLTINSVTTSKDHRVTELLQEYLRNVKKYIQQDQWKTQLSPEPPVY